MIRLLRNNNILSLVAIVSFLIGMATVMHAIGPISTRPIKATPLAAFLIDLVAIEGTNRSFLMALLLIIVQSVLFGILAERNQLLYKSTYLPALFYGLFSICYPEQLRLNPELIASTFLLLAVTFLFSFQGVRQALPALFNAGVIGAMAFLISPSTILFLPVFLSGILSLKPARVIDFIQFLAGYILLVFFCFTWLKWEGDAKVIDAYLTHFNFTANLGGDWLDWNVLFLGALIGITLIPTFFRLQQNFFRNTIRARKLQGFLLVYLIFGLAYSVFGAASVHTSGTVLALPLSIFFTYYFLSDKRRLLRESIFLIFLFAIIAQHLSIF